jgi:hypothetical protein
MLLEPGVQRERARRKEAMATGELRARPALYACASSKERGRESSAMSKEGLVPHVDLVEQFLVLPCLFMRSTRIGAEKRGNRHIELRRSDECPEESINMLLILL